MSHPHPHPRPLSHTARSQAPPLIPILQPQNTYTLTTDLSHLLDLLSLKLQLLQTRTPESIAPDYVIPPQQLRYRGWITSIDVALQRDVAKLLRYQGLGRGDEEVCRRLVGEVRRVRGVLARGFAEGAFAGVDAVVEMVGGWVGGR